MLESYLLIFTYVVDMKGFSCHIITINVTKFIPAHITLSLIESFCSFSSVSPGIFSVSPTIRL